MRFSAFLWWNFKYIQPNIKSYYFCVLSITELDITYIIKVLLGKI